jgi:hypothetical protein
MLKKMVMMMLVAVLFATAKAEVIFDDNFNGTVGSSLDSTYWVTNGTQTLNGDGTATIGDATLVGKATAAPTESEFVRATFVVSAAQWNMGFDITSGAPGSGIILRNDLGDSQWCVEIDGQGQYHTGFSKPWSWGGDTVYTIQVDWYTTKVVISVAENGGIIYDSSINTPSWVIPTDARHINAWAYGQFKIDQAGLKTMLIPVAGGIIFNDEFNGSTLNSAIWSWFTSAISIDHGKCIFNTSGSNGFQSITSDVETYGFLPVKDVSFGRVTFDTLGGGILWSMNMGLTGPGCDILLRGDLGGERMWTVEIKDAGVSSLYPTDISADEGGTWVIEWYADRVVVYHDGVIKFDSNLNSPLSGATTWQFPTEAMSPDIGGSGGEIMTVEGIKWEIGSVGGTAKNPSPVVNSRRVPLNVTLSWEPGSFAAAANGHNLYISDDQSAVGNRTVAPIILTSNSYSITGLQYNKTYYWCVDEYNPANSASPWLGQVWSFDTVVSPNVIIDEHFDGKINSQPDANDWDFKDPNFESMDGASNMVFHKCESYLYARSWGPSSKMYVPVANQHFGRMTITLGGSICWNTVMGLGGYGSDNIYLRTDYGDGLWNVCISNARYPLNISRSQGTGTWVIEWFIDRVRVFHNTVLVFDTKTAGTTFTIPSSDMRPIVDAYGGVEVMKVDRIVWDKVTSTCISDETGSADINGDCIVDFKDLSILSSDWLFGDSVLTATAPASGSLVAKYDFELDATDSAGYSGGPFDGTITGSSTWVTGYIGDYAINFDGANGNYVNCGTFNPSESTGQLTIATWVYWKGQNQNYGALVAKRNAWDSSAMMWDLSVGDYDTDSSNDGIIKFLNMSNRIDWTDYKLPLEKWTHVAVTFDGSNVILYIDGLAVSEAEPFTFDPGVGATVFIGSSQYGAEGFNGSMDDVRLYNAALTPSQIAYVYLNGPGQVHVPLASKANLSNTETQGSQRVNLEDFAVIASQWMDSFAWPNNVN